MNRIYIIFLLLVSITVFSQSEKEVKNQQIVWYTYNVNWKLNNNWQLVTDVSERQFINPTAQHLWSVRANFKRVITANWDFGFGGSLFIRKLNDPYKTNPLIVPELRPHIEFNNTQKLGFGTLNSRYRIEARLYQNTKDGELSDGYYFNNFRLRYLLGWTFPIIKNKNTSNELVFVKIQDEIMVNAGSKIVRNTFDQNRIYLALNYKVSNKFSIETGYLNSFQQQPIGDEFLNRNILRLTIFQKIE
ncbi:DUF2490 domain-containing protein [Flavobacterium paronense]|uniref:DUF2490 domain-containing protein n=1 Tax=Flavobacterium paronense TaxID=1392775 RepID=A0ABV5GH49_9FLAO|nr:DUF2490 domain-containing protein [Flavobacterium paronense]MDN3676381.1 DUF2490 domain-containing protein [Flavobacterium paronense]